MRRNTDTRDSRMSGASTNERSGSRLLASLALAFVIAMFMLPGSAQAWWNDEWSMRKKVMLDTSSTGSGITDSIGNVPILVRLHAGNFRFVAAKEDGSDLRFVAGDDKTPLKYHVEKYDALLGEALIWVSVPNMQPGAKSDIWLYYGNKKAVTASDPKGTYSSETALVYHFTERGTPAQDSSVWANGAQSTGQAADGSLIGTGLRLDGLTPLTVPATASLTFGQDGQLTWSAWIKPAALQRNAAIYSRRENGNALVIGLDDGAPFVEITVNGSAQRSAAGAPVAPGGWHHVALVATPGLVTLYLDGNPYGSLSATLPALNSVALIGGDAAVALAAPLDHASVQPSPTEAAAPSAAPAGGDPTAAAQAPLAEAAAVPSPDGAAPTDGAAPQPADPSQAVPVATPAPAPVAPVASAMPGFAGDMDELEIVKAARPAGYIKAIAINQGTDPSKFIAFSVDEETSSWLSGYFGVILKSVTFDGWVVIGILLIMAVASWMVMVEKNSYLGRQRKANTLFLGQFRLLQDDLTLLLARTADKAQQNSSLLRIYHVGAEEIRKRFPIDQPSRPHVLTAEAIAAIRAALDASFVREMQVLNKLMVILTIAISGGPFLGLLGTVVGVMVTFAAIAMSGDVNINAIAPGVAGALMATVAGLAVAIPALFGYNYLSIRIRDLTSDMQVFVDEFTTKMAEAYSANRPGPVQHRIAAE
jgi:biopolymer transport protein ExbB